MLNGKRPILENSLKVVFEAGYLNAAASFSKLAQDKIQFRNFQHSFQRLNSNFFSNSILHNRNVGNHLITTEIFGDIVGKSYLFLSDQEFEKLSSNVSNPNLKEEFIKELDNILSASVITHLSNNLKVKIYGDTPLFVGKANHQIEDIIYGDFKEKSEEVYINSIFFSFETQPVINPFFVWVIGSQILQLLEVKEN